MMLTKEGVETIKRWTAIVNAEAPDEIKDAEMTPTGTGMVAEWLCDNGHSDGLDVLQVNLILAASVFDAAKMGIVSWDEVLDAMVNG